MPEFILDHGNPAGAALFNSLSPFEQGYLEAMFFTDTGDSENGDLETADVSQLAPETITHIKTDCAAFIEAMPRDHHGRTPLDLAFDYAPTRYNETAAGHDFWLTRNHHGAGFWDRGLGAIGDKLSDIAHTFGNIDLYRGDNGLIYLA